MLTRVDTTKPVVVVPNRIKKATKKFWSITSTIATAVIVATNRPACSLSLKQVAIVKTAANVYVSGELPNQEISSTAYAEPIADAGNLTIPFRIESETVGSRVTIAVITAKTGGQF